VVTPVALRGVTCFTANPDFPHEHVVFVRLVVLVVLVGVASSHGGPNRGLPRCFHFHAGKMNRLFFKSTFLQGLGTFVVHLRVISRALFSPAKITQSSKNAPVDTTEPNGTDLASHLSFNLDLIPDCCLTNNDGRVAGKMWRSERHDLPRKDLPIHNGV